MASTVLAPDNTPPVESSSSAISWSAIIAGAFSAATLTFVLILLGSGLGLTMISPWTNQGASVTTFAVSAAIWMIVVQWLSSALGGYMTGRLRVKWVGIHTDETFFRDTARSRPPTRPISDSWWPPAPACRKPTPPLGGRLRDE